MHSAGAAHTAACNAARYVRDDITDVVRLPDVAPWDAAGYAMYTPEEVLLLLPPQPLLLLLHCVGAFVPSPAAGLAVLRLPPPPPHCSPCPGLPCTHPTLGTHRALVAHRRSRVRWGPGGSPRGDVRHSSGRGGGPCQCQWRRRWPSARCRPGRRPRRHWLLLGRDRC